MPIRLLARPTRSSSPSPLSPSASSESLYTLLDQQLSQPQRRSSYLPSRAPRVSSSSYSRKVVLSKDTNKSNPVTTSSIAIGTFVTGAVIALFSNVLFSSSTSSSYSSTFSSHSAPGHGSYWQRVGDTLEWVAAGIPESWGTYDFFADDNIFWTYNRGTKSGPENWGKLRNLSSPTQELMFPLCDSARIDAQQSPINIISESSEDPLGGSISTLHRHFDDPLQFEIAAWPAPGSQPSPGFQVRPILGNASWTIDGKEFFLWQFHYHSPSDHLLDGIRFPLEAHFVYQHFTENGDTELAVFGILYPFDVFDDANPFLEPWWKNIYHEVKLEAGKIDLQGMINDLASYTFESSSGSIGHRDRENKATDISPTYFRYNGSLTTPPCLEGINWFVAKSAHGISFKQAREYAVALKLVDNHRDVQQLNNRVINRHQL